MIATGMLLVVLGVPTVQPDLGDEPRPMCIALEDPRRLGASAPDITLEVDATDLPRSLVRSRQSIRTTPGPLDLWYVLWTPGNHTPSGPIENVVDLFICDCNGAPIDWRRDHTNVNRITLHVPEGCDHINVSMAYIAGQPNINSRSTDTYGRPSFGAINWNTLLWYPAGEAVRDIDVWVSLQMPRGWSIASALPLEPRAAEGQWAGGPFTLSRLVDSPLIAGEALKSRPLELGEGGDDPDGLVPHAVHAVSADPRSAEITDFLAERTAEMVRQTWAVFGPFPRSRYEFLLMAGDGLGGAVEHNESTFITTGTNALADAKLDEHRGGAHHLQVITHEYIHVWNGKVAAPAGLIRDDFHTHPDTALLWVYEGLTTYYTDVLSTRAAMATPAEYRERLTDSIVLYQQRAGRLWRSVEDTALAARHLRQRGIAWHDLRQGQEYYGQAAMFWLEADAIIRAGTDNARSLDDVCRALFDVDRFRAAADRRAHPADWAPLTYTRDDVVATLKSVYPGEDWDGLIRRRIERPAEMLEMSELLGRLGLQLEWADEPSAMQRRRQSLDDRGNPRAGGSVNLRLTLGIVADAKGVVTEIVPGSPADRAGIAYSARIVAAAGWAFTPERLADAVRASRESGSITLLVEFGDRITEVVIPYDGGLRWPRLVPIEGRHDRLTDILAPR